MRGEPQEPSIKSREMNTFEYGHSSDARIRRELLNDTIDGKDFYRDNFLRLGLRGDERILNVGSGDGLDEVFLATEIGHRGQIIGIDLPSLDDVIGQVDTTGLEDGDSGSVSSEFDSFDTRFYAADEELREHGITNVRFLPADAEDLPFEENSFDVVLWMHSAYYFRDVRRALWQTRRVLVPGGKFLEINNGAENKVKFHQAVSKIKAALGVYEHRPISAKFNMQKSQRDIPRFFEVQEAIIHDTYYRITENTKPHLIDAADTYRAGLPQEAREGWAAARDRVLYEYFGSDIDEYGTAYDRAQRGGGLYRKTGDIGAEA